MDILSLLSSVNKISLVAFVCVFGALIYEILLLKKSKIRKGKPTIPKFNTNMQAQAAVGKTLIDPNKKKSSLRTSRMGIFLVLIIVVLCMIGVFAIGRLLQGSQGEQTNQSINTRASDITPTVDVNMPIITSTPTPTPVVTEIPENTPTPTVPAELSVTPSIAPEDDDDDDLLALNTTLTPTVQVTPTVTSAPTPLVTQSSSTVVPQTTTPTPVQQLPLTGNTSFTVMAIGISGIIVLLSFVF